MAGGGSIPRARTGWDEPPTTSCFPRRRTALPFPRTARCLLSAAAGVATAAALAPGGLLPAARAALAVYREAWGLPACRRRCFRIINGYGESGPLPALAGPTGWAVEAALDLDVVSAICPRCHLLLVEARSASVPDLGAAVSAAA